MNTGTTNRRILTVLAVLVFAFLYLPILVVVIYAFNPDNVNGFPMSGFSLKWFGVMMGDRALLESLGHSLMIAIVSVVIAVLLGVPGAIVMYKRSFPGKHFLNRVILLPLILPGILTGIAMLTFLNSLGIRQGMFAVVIGHSTFLIAVVLPQVYTRLQRMDQNIEEAAHDLGAGNLQTFLFVILPNIRTAIISAALLAFTLSLDEIPVTYFLNGTFSTLPIQIWGMTRNGITPEVNAISAVVFGFSLILIVISNLIAKRGD
jgi:spermidine/putrescine transport system permease protein